MVQRLAHLGKVYMKEKQEKREAHKKIVQKRVAKETEKRDAK